MRGDPECNFPHRPLRPKSAELRVGNQKQTAEDLRGHNVQTQIRKEKAERGAPAGGPVGGLNSGGFHRVSKSSQTAWARRMVTLSEQGKLSAAGYAEKFGGELR